MPNNTDTFQRIAERLKEMSSRRTIAITYNTEVYGDLGLYGLDIVELMNWITDEFGIQGTIDIGPYGPPDIPRVPFLHPPVMRRLRKWLGIAEPQYKSLKVSHLLEVIKARHWSSI